MSLTSHHASPLFDTLVQSLVQARRSNTPWQPPAFEDTLSVEDAYRIQQAVAAQMGWFAEGKVPAWKAGGKGVMTAAPLPVLLPSGATWQPGATRELIAEAELAFRLARTPTSAQDVLDCIGSVCVSIEVVGTRMVGGLGAPGAWKTADQQVHGVLVAGTEHPYRARTPQEWAQQACVLEVNGAVQAEGTGTHPNGNPPAPLPWLIAHAAAQGLPLQAGTLVTTGAWALCKIAPGDRVTARFPGVGETSVQIAAS
jgi:2-keto-4-pentenoate hydratase